MSNTLDLSAPHGFLIWTGKQTAIANELPLNTDDKLLITSDGEAFGHAKLEKPATMNEDEFDRDEWAKEHCVRPNERRLYWPGIKSFYVHRIASFEPFTKPKIYIDGKVLDEPELSTKQHDIISKSRLLPKTISLERNAVILTDNGEVSFLDDIVNTDYLNAVLRATYQTDIKTVDEIDGEGIPIYSLALVRNPRLRVVSEIKKNEIKQEGENMPWEIRERDNGQYCVVKIDNNEEEGCHDTREEAEDQLTALNIAESEGSKQESMLQRVDRIMKQFYDVFENNINVWVKDIYDSHLIVDNDGILYRVNYIDAGNGLAFTDPATWKEVEVSYTDKAAELLKSFEKDEPEQSQSWLTQMKLAFKSVLKELVSPEEPETSNHPFNLDLSQPYGVAQKEVNGEPWHVMWATNAFMDRDGEIFSTASLEKYVEQNSEREDKGYFNFWHINEEDGNFNTDFAVKQWQAVIGRFLIEAGPYTDDKKGKLAKEFFNEYGNGHPDIAPEGWGGSPEYKYLPEERKTGIYENIWITRTSTLPRMAAANIWTEAGQYKDGDKMALSQEQKEAAIALFKSEDFVNSLISEAEKKTQDLENAGVAHKEKKETETAPPEFELNMDELAKAVAGQFEASNKPVLEAIEILGESIKTVAERVEQLEKDDKARTITETPRWKLSMVRASEADETALSEDDSLKEKRPKETKPQNKSGTMADHFFSGQ